MELLAAALSRIPDALILLFFVSFAVFQGSRGLAASLAPLLVTLIALAGAAVLSLTLTEPVTSDLRYSAEQMLLTHMDAGAIRTTSPDTMTTQLQRLMPEIFRNALEYADVDFPHYVAESCRSAAPGATPKEIAEQALRSALLPVLRRYVRISVFVLSFFSLKLLLSLLRFLLDLEVPVAFPAALDTAGGAVIGVLWCAGLLTLALRLANLLLPTLFAYVKASSELVRLLLPAG